MSSNSGFKTWIFTIAKNTAIDFLRKSLNASYGKKMTSFSELEDEFEKNTLAENLADPSPLSNEILERKDNALIITASQIPRRALFALL